MTPRQKTRQTKNNIDLTIARCYFCCINCLRKRIWEQTFHETYTRIINDGLLAFAGESSRRQISHLPVFRKASKSIKPEKEWARDYWISLKTIQCFRRDVRQILTIEQAYPNQFDLRYCSKKFLYRYRCVGFLSSARFCQQTLNGRDIQLIYPLYFETAEFVWSNFSQIVSWFS